MQNSARRESADLPVHSIDEALRNCAEGRGVCGSSSCATINRPAGGASREFRRKNTWSDFRN